MIIRLRWYAALTILIVLCGIFGCGFAAAHAAAVQVDSHELPSVRLPILMYHHFLKEEAKQGKYVISPLQFEQDLQNLIEEGYTAIGVKDLVDYAVHGALLPEKPIMITVDDGYESFYSYAYPLLKKYNCKAVVTIIGRYSDLYSETDDHHINYSHMTWEELLEMQESGLVEIQNHSYDLHDASHGRKGCSIQVGEDPGSYRAMLQEDIGRLQTRLQEQLGAPAAAFAYPFGYLCTEADEVLREMGFMITFSCEEKVNNIDPQNLYHLGRFNRASGLSSKEFFKKFGSFG